MSTQPIPPVARVTSWLRPTPLYGPLAFICGRRIIVRGNSMYPLLAPGERVLVDRLAYCTDGPRRGDVVLVERAGQAPGRLIKMVVGLPGERVAVAQDRLWVGRRRLALPQPVISPPPREWVLGADEYFLLSYSPAAGTDSRHVGPVAGAAVRGKAWWVFWPPSRRRMLGQVPLGLDEYR